MCSAFVIYILQNKKVYISSINILKKIFCATKNFVGLCEQLYRSTIIFLTKFKKFRMSKFNMNNLIDTHDIKLDEESFEEDYFQEKPSKWKKIFTISLAAFLILLMLSYFWMSSGLDEIILSLAESEELEGGIVKINDTSDLVFKKESYQNLLENYLQNQDKEFKACLIGEIKSNNYEVTETFIPEMIEQRFNMVVSKSCPGNTIIELHSQPYRKCIESGQDIKTKEIIQKMNPRRLMVIMCEKARFNFY